MKNQALFSSKGKSKKLNCRLLQFLFDALRVKRSLKVYIYIAMCFCQFLKGDNSLEFLLFSILRWGLFL